MKIIILLLLAYSSCGLTGTVTPSTNTPTESLTMSTINFNVTDIPQSDIDDALNLDVGKYTPQTFHYANFQNTEWNNKIYNRWNRFTNSCFEQYTRCVMNLVAPMTVCAYHDKDNRNTGFGMRDFASYCDVFLNNCRRGVRYWRIFDYGKCIYEGVEMP